MKRLILSIIMLLMLASSAMAGSVTVLDSDCQNYGYDYGLARWAWNSQNQVYEKTLGDEAYSTLITGDSTQATWVSSHALMGVVSNEDCFVQVLPGGESGLIDVYSDDDEIQFITLCADNSESDDSGDNGDGDNIADVPEFGTLAAIAVLIASGIFIMKKRQDSNE